jgi:two-component system response regulator HydG
MTDGLSILVVDDDVDNAMSLGELFEMEGHRVKVVHNGNDAIEAYVNASFDVAFMDVMMPGKNGVESFLEIRRLKPRACVYLMTGYSVEELLRQAVKEGALGVLEKPFEPEEVLRMADSVGPGGLVVSTPAMQTRDVGSAVHHAILESGRGCKLVRERSDLSRPVKSDDVLVLDTKSPLIDSVSLYKDVQKVGHVAPTIIVPRAAPTSADTHTHFRNINITGVLNKPFDPLDLLSQLPVLAA